MYQLLVWVKNTRVWMLIRGVLIIMLFFLTAAIFQMNRILWLGEKLISVALTVFIVVFQSEASSNIGTDRPQKDHITIYMEYS